MLSVSANTESLINWSRKHWGEVTDIKFRYKILELIYIFLVIDNSFYILLGRSWQKTKCNGKTSFPCKGFQRKNGILLGARMCKYAKLSFSSQRYQFLVLTEHVFRTEHVTSEGNFNKVSSEHLETEGLNQWKQEELGAHTDIFTLITLWMQVTHSAIKSFTQFIKCSQLIKKPLSKVF